MLSGGLGVANTIITSHNIVVLVKEPEVDGIPDGTKSQGDNSEDQSGVEENSGGVGLLIVEADGESQGNDKRDAQEDTDENVPPVNVVIEDLVENFEELAYSNKYGQKGNELNTALDWEQNAAFVFLGSFVGALADTAAAHISVLTLDLVTNVLAKAFLLG